MTRKILGLALPNIITNITVPLLGIVDMAIVGHLSAIHIAAISIGTAIFNLIYWCFGFLRMGTSGFAAQAYGARNMSESVKTLVRGMAIAWSIALLLIIFQRPILRIALLIFNGGKDVWHLTLIYFFVRIWAAPATLGLFALKGWFIGMQNSKLPMWMAIFINVVNIIFSLIFVVVLKWDIMGVALGTVIAQYSGLIIGGVFAMRYYGRIIRKHFNLKGSLNFKEMTHFFKVNGDIFLRTVCLATVFTFMTSTAGKISDEILAINAILMQFFTLFSYIMDGFAYAGESLVGRYIGANDNQRLHQTIKHLMLWGLIMTVVFTGIYAIGDDLILRIFTDDTHLINQIQQYLIWVLVIPVCGFSAFIYDGIYVGATASKTMRNAMFIASLSFFAVYYGIQLIVNSSCEQPMLDATHNNILWIAFMVYLAMRGIIQAAMMKKSIYSKIK